MTNQRIVPYPSSVGIVVYAMTAVAQNATDSCKPTRVIPLTANEPAAKIVIDPPLAEPLASRGVAIVQYCAQNLHIAPVFGLGGPTSRLDREVAIKVLPESLTADLDRAVFHPPDVPAGQMARRRRLPWRLAQQPPALPCSRWYALGL
jgi:hypothetical protein